MPRTCTICGHVDRVAIDQALINKASLRNIAERFGLSTTALHRHKSDHLPAALTQAKAAGEIMRADDLLGQIQDLQKKTLAILARSQDDRIALVAIREARSNLELLGRLLGELQTQPIVNIWVNQEWIELRTMILIALEPFPQAKLALAAALSEAENV